MSLSQRENFTVNEIFKILRAGSFSKYHTVNNVTRSKLQQITYFVGCCVNISKESEETLRFQANTKKPRCNGITHF